MIRMLVPLLLAACSSKPDPAVLAIRHYGCGTCHQIPSVDGAVGHVGPPLGGLATREYLAGRVPNTPDQLVRWIQHPQAVVPGNVMPEMGVTDRDAQDIAEFLLR